MINGKVIINGSKIILNTRIEVLQKVNKYFCEILIKICFTFQAGGAKSALFFDPDSSTLYVDSNLANTLDLADGTTVELPTNVLLDSINQGQVQLLSNNRRIAGKSICFTC